jgi:hypothetical protein
MIPGRGFTHFRVMDHIGRDDMTVSSQRPRLPTFDHGAFTEAACSPALTILGVMCLRADATFKQDLAMPSANGCSNPGCDR